MARCQLELIHMNGRVYDYNVGRFTGVDPVIQAPLNQSLNPYSYILNNPLSGTDPSGYVSCGDVTSGDPGKSGSCASTSPDGKTMSVDYKVGKDGSVSVTSSGTSFSSKASANLARAANGNSGDPRNRITARIEFFGGKEALEMALTFRDDGGL